ncbi:chromosomal replication initiation protein [Tannerella sp. oral taxon BU063 isolate Cell 8/11]|uniref:Chromosomal replication initiator protein DnaA n=1 Tax=Tannerella sp. oral taxon BU063 isolate Cell 8/11 TaxID=1411915 RepID=W2D0F8_9BACT|nr:chromosomal replication initiation protein [Tannerella sp. oral taxon BU063 isolate Cell 8/11]
MPEAAFKTWFQPITPLSFDEQKVTIRVPSPFFYEYLEANFVNVLRMAVPKVFGQGVSLNYRVMGEEGADDASSAVSARAAAPSPGVSRMIQTPFTQVAPEELDSQLNRRYTFDNFFEGVTNKLARTAGVAVSNDPGKTTFNPLFIYGPSGVGKTHLCHAIGLRIRQMHPEKRVLYVSAHRFRIQYTDAVIKNTSNDFLNFYQSLDVLILDDIHELVGLNKTQMAFFHIFNNLHQLGKQLVLTADKAPVDMQGLEERLITRLKWGLTAELGRPDAELRRTILRNKIEAEGLVLSDEVFNYIVDHVTENIRDLEGVLVSLMANSLINNSPVDMAMAQRVVGQTVRVENKELSIEKIQEKVCRFFNLEESLVQTPSRKREIVQARQITMFLAKKYTSASFSRIGKVVGGKDHATVLHACKTVKDQMDINKNFRSTVEAIEETLRS